jgi:hypothetical protein
LSYNAEHGVLELRIPYDPSGRRQDIAKAIYGCAWSSAKKAWEYPATVDSAKALVAAFDPDAGHGYAEWYQSALKDFKAAQRAAALLDGKAEIVGGFGFEFATEPFAHQRRYCEWAATRDLAGLTYRANYSQQGTGKTKCEVDMTTWELGRRICRGVPLVLCPNSVKTNWCRELLIHGPREFYAPVPLSGSCEEKLAALDRARQLLGGVGLVPVVIANYEVLSQPTQRPVLDRLLELAQSGFFGKLIFDESTAVRSTKSKRGKAAHKLAQNIPIRVVMTGTPFPKRATDVFNPTRVLSPAILGTSWAAFRRHHVVFGGWQNREEIGYRNLEELREKVDRHAFRVLLDECVDLPEEVLTTRTCDLGPQQVQATAALKKQMMAELESEDGPMVLSAHEAMVRLLRFNQISSGWLRDHASGKLAVFDPNPKLDLLLDYLRDEVGEDEKAVVWCCFQDDVERVSSECDSAGMPAVRYYGKNRATREDAEQRFIEDQRVRVMVATPDAGGWGLNWQVACHCVFYSYDFDWEAMAQARARIRRVTQRQRMTYTWLVAENPQTRARSHGASTGINNYILENLRATSKMADHMTGDTARLQGEDPGSAWRRAMEAL